jgi:hypothetical protein
MRILRLIGEKIRIHNPKVGSSSLLSRTVPEAVSKGAAFFVSTSVENKTIRGSNKTGVIVV